MEGEIIGAGNLKIVHEVENELVEMNLNFLKPWKSKATTTFELEETIKVHAFIGKWKAACLFLFWMKKQMQIFVEWTMTAGSNY